MALLITKKEKKVVKEFNNCLLEIFIPPNVMLEMAYRIPADREKRVQIAGGYLYIKLGDELFPAVVEFSREEIKMVGERITKEQLLREAVTRGRIFFQNRAICTCWEFTGILKSLPYSSFTIVDESKISLRVVAYRQANAAKGKRELAIIF